VKKAAMKVAVTKKAVAKKGVRKAKAMTTSAPAPEAAPIAASESNE
jgi:hypothetical protein